LINKCNKSVEKNKDKRNKQINITDFNNNKQDYMIKEKEKKKMNIKEKYN
jgi:hypothetical protein